jgi:hypothetical protein
MSRFARKRDDSVKPGCGIDGKGGERFTKEHVSSPWSPPATGDKIMPGGGRYTDNKSGLRNKQPDDVSNTPARDIWDVVESNQPDDGNRGLKPRGGQS